MKPLLLVLTAFVSFGALAQPAVLSPASPTSSGVITATFVVLPCERTVTTVVTGSLVTTTVTMGECVIITPPIIHDTATFGPLPVGVYTYEVYYRFGTEPPVLRSRQQFAVQAPAIPSLSIWGSLVMAASLTVVALMRPS